LTRINVAFEFTRFIYKASLGLNQFLDQDLNHYLSLYFIIFFLLDS
jgi:hypothetical protein